MPCGQFVVVVAAVGEPQKGVEPGEARNAVPVVLEGEAAITGRYRYVARTGALRILEKFGEDLRNRAREEPPDRVTDSVRVDEIRVVARLGVCLHWMSSEVSGAVRRSSPCGHPTPYGRGPARPRHAACGRGFDHTRRGAAA